MAEGLTGYVIDRLPAVAAYAGAAGFAISAMPGMAKASVTPKYSRLGAPVTRPIPAYDHHSLKALDQLRGFGIGLGAEDLPLEELEASSVIVANYEPVTLPDGSSSYEESSWCSGNERSYKGQVFDELAGHCQVQITGSDNGIFDRKEFAGTTTNALNIYNISPLLSYVQTPNAVVGDRQTIGEVTGIDISTQDDDVALDTSTPYIPTIAQPASGKVSPETSVPSPTPIPLTPTPKFVPGQEVAIYSSPGNNAAPVAETGTYVGRIELDQYADENNGDNIQNNPISPANQAFNSADVEKDVVIIRPQSASRDGCYWGASGSQFAALAAGHSTGRLKKVVFSGPLSGRIAQSDADNSNSTTDTQGDERRLRRYVEDTTGVYVSYSEVVCLYSVVKKSVELSLVNGFGNMIPGTSKVDSSSTPSIR